MRNSYPSVVVAVALALVLQLPSPAHAGPVELLTQLTLHPSNPDVMVVRYSNGGDGLLFSEDGGSSWKMLCVSAIDRMLRSAGTISLAGDGRLLLGAFDGLYQDQGNGCGFAMDATMEGRWITDITPHPTEPNVSFLITSTGNEAENGVVQRAADGTFTDLGEKLVMQISRLRVVSNGDQLRFYQGAVAEQVMVTLDGGTETFLPRYVIRVSDDDAQTFREFNVGTLDARFRLQEIDPQNPDRIVAVIDREGENDEVLVSSNQGETFETYFELSQFGALAFAPDGRVFIGEARTITNPGASVGLWSAESLDSEPQKIGDYPVQCLAYQGATDTLFACQPYAFGKADPSSGSFTELFDFATVEEFVSCEGVDMPSTCEAQLCRDYCGPGHFAQAPVCEVYTTAFCGPCVVAMESGATSCGSAGMPAGGAGGTSGRAAAGSSAAGSGGSAELDAGTTAGRTGDGGGGGCSTRAPADGDGAAAWLSALLCVLIGRRRRR